MTDTPPNPPLSPTSDFDLVRDILLQECKHFSHYKSNIFKEIDTNKRAITASYQIMQQCLTENLMELDVIVQLDIVLERLNTQIAMSFLNQVEEHELTLKYLTRIPSMFFQLHINKLKILKKLIVDGQNSSIMHITAEIGLLNGLKYLDISGCQLKQIPESIQHLESLEILKIHHNHISALPDGICKLPNLKELDVSHNHELDILPKNIGHLKHLQKLIIAHDNLESLPEAIGLLDELSEIIADHNHLKSLPESIGNLVHLKTLDVHDNELKSLPPNIATLPGLKYVNFAGNLLPEIPTDD